MNALERELQQAHVDEVEQARRIARLEDELAHTKRELARVKQPPAPKAVSATWPPPRPPRSATPMVFVCIAVVAATAMFGVVAMRANRFAEPRRYEPPHAVVKLPPAPEHVLYDDVAVMISEARVRAARSLPGAVLVGVRAEGVTRQGQLHPDDGLLIVEFQRAPQPGTGRPRYECLSMTRTSRGWEPADDDDHATRSCIEPRQAAEDLVPRCGTRNIWQRAIDQGAASDGVASVRFDGTWRFVTTDAQGSFDGTYADNCVP